MRWVHAKLQILIKLSLLLLFFNTILLSQSLYYDRIENSSNQEKIKFNYKKHSFPDSTNVLFNNGPLINLPSGGCSDYDASILDATLGLTNYGFGAALLSGYGIADDFISYATWNIDSIKFFVYQTGAITPTINGVYVQIYNGNPSTGGTVVWGDLTTNRLQNTGFLASPIYRASNLTPTDCGRQIQEAVATMGVNLPSGQYWIEVSYVGSLASGPWQPPVTIAGIGNTGDAYSHNITGHFWTQILNGNDTQGMPFIIYGTAGEPCPVEPAFNPIPADSSYNVNINLNNLSWTNGLGTTNIELYFGKIGEMVNVYDGPAINTFMIPSYELEYSQTYQWKVVSKNDTCIYFTNEIWHFKTESNPTIQVDTVYPNFAQYWTGSTDGVTKNDGEVRGYDDEDGWMMFDLSDLPHFLPFIISVTFEAYVNSTNWPYWSITPMSNLNPLIASALDIKSTIENNSTLDSAYLYSNEMSSFTTGWKSIVLGGNITTDIERSFGRDWFAIGIDSRDNSQNYWINFDGWNQMNVPYLIIQSCLLIPVELTSFTAEVNKNRVVLNWATTTETNNQGFEIERMTLNKNWEKVGFVNGAGTTTEPQNYSFMELNLSPDNYIYRLKQLDFNGDYEYSKVIEVIVNKPLTFSLEQNYPNPFNPVTKISWELPLGSLQTLKMFDVLGKEVATLVNEYREAGKYNINFDGSKLASGIYYYQLKAGDFIAMKKMILLK